MCWFLLPVSEYPSCLQTTLASGVPQKSSQTVPQLLFKQTSTRPSKLVLPPINLTSPSVQANTTIDTCQFKCIPFQEHIQEYTALNCVIKDFQKTIILRNNHTVQRLCRTGRDFNLQNFIRSILFLLLLKSLSHHPNHYEDSSIQAQLNV